MRARADADVYQAANRQNVPLCLSLQGGGPAGAGLVCGFLGCDARPFNPLLAALPRVIHLPAAREGTAAARRPHRSRAGRIDRAPTGQRGRAVAIE